MASRALNGCYTVIKIYIWPSVGGVTIFTVVVAWNVILIFSWSQTSVMTGFTSFWRALEHPTDMAAFAFNIFMGACKVEACSEVFGRIHYSAGGKRLKRKEGNRAKQRYTNK